MSYSKSLRQAHLREIRHPFFYKRVEPILSSILFGLVMLAEVIAIQVVATLLVVAPFVWVWVY